MRTDFYLRSDRNGILKKKCKLVPGQNSKKILKLYFLLFLCLISFKAMIYYFQGRINMVLILISVTEKRKEMV